MAEKQCFRCNAVKPVSEFYSQMGMADGLLGKCKECTKSDVKKRAHDPAVKGKLQAYEKARSKTASRKRQRREAVNRWRKKNKLKNRAHFTLNNAIRRGKIVRLPCEVCGDMPTDGHHVNYSRPLDVRWLCRLHHVEIHRITLL